MSLFKKHKYYYPEPERITPADARSRRLEGLLERERRFMDLPNFPTKLAEERSRVVKDKPLGLAKQIVNEPIMKVHKAALIAAALSQFKEKDFADPVKRDLYRKLRAAQGGQQKVSPTGGDRRFYHPDGPDRWPSTVFGTPAYFKAGDQFMQRPDRFQSFYGVDPTTSWTRVFMSPGLVIPCVQRHVRREVMFALKHAGRGYHTRKRRTWQSGVPC